MRCVTRKLGPLGGGTGVYSVVDWEDDAGIPSRSEPNQEVAYPVTASSKGDVSKLQAQASTRMSLQTSSQHLADKIA